MLERLGHLLVRRRHLILLLSAVIFVVAGALGGGVAEHLSSGGFDNEDAESFQADQVLSTPSALARRTSCSS